MIDIPSIFKNKTLDTVKLTAYGFHPTQYGFEKSFPIMQGQYSVIILITSDGTADFRVFDSEMGEEYIPAHLFNSTGSFIGEVHKECEAILKGIAENCYYTEYFKWDQTKRILCFIKETYHAEPEFLWSSLPECAALRFPGKKPWFAVAGRIPKEKIGIEEVGLAEVINLKDEPKAVTARINEKKAYPAYHMNKKHWYTVLLNESLTDDEIINLVKTSFEIVNG